MSYINQLTISEFNDAWKALGERLRFARRRRGLSQEAMAERMGVSRQTVVRLENGDAGIRLETLGMALRALGLGAEIIDTIADPAQDRIGLSEEKRRVTRKVASAASAPSDPRDVFDFGPRAN